MHTVKQNYKIPLVLLLLVLAIAYLSYYNYTTQKKLLLTQMQKNSLSVVNSVATAIERFEEIKSTMNLQKLINDVSFNLEIFEFRYLEPDGIIKNSMFKAEIGKVLQSKSFERTMQGTQKLKEFFFETRDYVDVMAIYYPIYKENELIGIIDLAIDISEYKVIQGEKEDFSVLRRKVDIMNLLKAIDGSIKNSLDVSAEADMHNFLKAYVNSTKSIIEISLIDNNHTIAVSSNKNIIGTTVKKSDLPPPSLVENKDIPLYKTIIKTTPTISLLLITDATTYKNHEHQLMQTAILTTLMALFLALFTTRTIYYSAIEQSRKEKEKLEHLVKERTRAIEILSKTDALTGLWNRHYLEEMLEMEFKRARRHQHEISMMVIDLDHFKKVNDTHGHMAGDEVLRQISNRITECLRETDFIGRYGGEELVVILPLTPLDVAKKIAEKILDAIASKPVMFESKDIIITASIGLSNLRSEHHDHLMVFAEADEALYKAKESGRNRIEIFEAEVEK